MLQKVPIWYLLTIALAFVAFISALIIPDNYLKSILSVIFVFFLPGFAIVNAIFPFRTLAGKSEIDTVERLVLSVGASMAIVPMVGLIFNYTPWELNQIPIVLSLLILTTVFGTLAVVRQSR